MLESMFADGPRFDFGQVVQNVISYNATISCCEKSGHWQAALQLFASMLDAQCTPDIISYSAFVPVVVFFFWLGN